MPENLNAKVWWILIGINDLALSTCSEDATILGILRVAEEVAFRNSHSKVVIQGLMPRSNHGDGTLHPPKRKRGSDYYIWPSIEEINGELKGFCDKHEQFIYFDAKDLFVQWENVKSVVPEPRLIKDLMPNARQPNLKGHQVLMGAVEQKLQEIFFAGED